MMTFYILLAAIYLFASIPFGLLISKYGYGIDIRTIGSGNIGATNIYRNLGAAPAIIVLLLDMSKGILAVYLMRHFLNDEALTVIAALVAIFGHSCSCFMKFKGGKGVATGLGAIVMLAPKIALICLGVFILLVYLTRYVSLGSVVGALLLPVLTWFFHMPMPDFYFGLLAAVFVVFRHRSNIQRLLKGEESKFGSK